MDTLIKKYGWHEWLAKTNFSFLQGASYPHEVLSTAYNKNYSSIAISDMDGVYGLARSHLFHKENSNNSTKLCFGAEIHLAQDHELPLLKQDTLALISIDLEGYKNLCQIISLCHKTSKAQAFISKDQLLGQNLKGLIAIQPMRGAMRDHQLKTQRWAQLKEAFNNDFFLTLSRHLHCGEDFWQKNVLHLAKQFDLQTLFSQDVFFHEPQKKPLWDLLQAIRTNHTLDQSQAWMLPNSERYLHSLPSLHKLYSPLPGYEKALILSKSLSERCQFSLGQLKYQYPSEMIPEGWTSQAYLEHITWTRARERLSQPLPEQIKQQLTKELQLIKHLNFADYFLTVWDIVNWARAQDILCQGRGSAANSCVCFVLGITSVNPLQFDLLFERFISMERGDPPDIDVDFEHERREEVIQYIYQRYGRKKAAMVANVISFKSKGALRATGKALGIHDDVLSFASKALSSKHLRGSPIKEVLQFTKQKLKTSQNLDTTNIPWGLWEFLTLELKGFPRHLGIHSGGFVISNHHLNQLVAQEPATMNERTVIQWCKEDIEGLGFFKIDILALGMLTALRKCFASIEATYNKKLNLHSLPNNDKKTYHMIQRAETVGAFQIESRAQMSMLPRLKPKCFYDLVIEIAIIRPGPIQGGAIHPYLKRRNGLEPVTYPDPRLEPILKRTLGIAIFQEQAMRIAIAVGNFSPGEANELRKHIGAWSISTFSRNINPWLNKLEQGMVKNNIAPDFRRQILGQMRGFSDYGFPESHSVSFALLAYASCYLKCHYPAAFFASILNSQPMGFYSPHALLQAAKRDKVTVLPLDINKSTYDHQLEELVNINTEGESRNNIGLRLGFRLVNDLSENLARQLIKEREKEGPFKSISEFIQRTTLYKDDFTALAAANVFECFCKNRKEALWYAQSLPQKPMIDTEEIPLIWANESPWQLASSDFESFNTTMGPHPTTLIKKHHWDYPIKPDQVMLAKTFAAAQAHQFIYSFGMILSKQAPPSAKGMVFATLEDESGFINLVFLPNTYEQYFETIEAESFLLIYGKIQKSGESHSLLVKKVISKKQDLAGIHNIQNNEDVKNNKGPSALSIQPRNYY